EHGQIAEHHRGGDGILRLPVLVEVDGRGGGVEQVDGLVAADDPRQPVGALRGPQGAAGVVVDDTVALEVAQVGAQCGGLAGDRGAGEAPGVEVREVAAQGAVVDRRRRRAAAALGPGHEFGDVVLVCVPRVGAPAGEGRRELVAAPRALAHLRRWPFRHAPRPSAPRPPARTLPPTCSDGTHRSVAVGTQLGCARWGTAGTTSWTAWAWRGDPRR